MHRDNSGPLLGFPTREARDFPNIVNLEVYRGACPCRCVHCPVGLTPPNHRASRFGTGAIELPLLDKVTREVGRHRWSTVRFHSVGDPVLWKDLGPALRIATRNKARSWLFTSAVTSDRELLNEIARNVNILEVSVNSSSSEDYMRTKGVDAFELVVENIRYLRRRKRNRRQARLIVSRVQAGNTDDAEFVSFWRSTGLVDDAFVRSFHTYNDLVQGRASAAASSCHQPCLVHWARFNVGLDGKAVVCFNELFKARLDPSLVLGDLHDQSIGDIWRGPKLAAIRNAVLTNNYTTLSFGRRLPCKKCRFCQPLRGCGQTSDHQVAELSARTGL